MCWRTTNSDNVFFDRTYVRLGKGLEPYSLKYCCLCLEVKNDDHALATLLLYSIMASIAFPYNLIFSLAAFSTLIAS